MSKAQSCGLYLELDDAAGAAERLSAAFSVAIVSAVLIRPQAAPRIESLRALVHLVQGKGAAAIVSGDAGLALSSGADGVHLAWSDDAADIYRQARSTLGADRIVGGEAGPLRHDAMVIGELGAEYVAFGRGGGSSGEGVPEDQFERVAWWGQVFEVPCVALGIDDAAAAARLAAEGADFIGWRLAAGQSPADVAAGLQAVTAALGARSVHQIG